jgi:hypothetical protein
VPAVAITDALPKIRAALYAALAPLVGTYDGMAKAYWLQAAQGAPLPLLVYQAQAPFQADDFLNSAAGGGLFTIRALAASAAAADTLLAGVPAALSSLSVSGYGCTVTFVEAPAIPPLDQVHTAALTYRIELFQ